MNRVDEFIATSKAPRGGGRCKTCAHANRKQVEADAVRFNELRGGTARDGKGKPLPATAMSWAHFVKHHLRVAYGYLPDHRALRAHMETCLGQTIN